MENAAIQLRKLLQSIYFSLSLLLLCLTGVTHAQVNTITFGFTDIPLQNSGLTSDEPRRGRCFAGYEKSLFVITSAHKIQEYIKTTNGYILNGLILPTQIAVRDDSRIEWSESSIFT